MNNTSSNSTTPEQQAAHPTLGEAFSVWFKIGILSFGGPAAQIALMHRMVVAERAWLTEKQFLNALSFCMLLPGPEAMQLATYAGWRLHGTRGGLLAGLLFVIPGAIIVLLLAMMYAYFGQVPLVTSLFLGIKAVVIIVVIEALLRVAKKALSTRWHWGIAGLAFIAIYFFNAPYPLIILAAAIVGYFFPLNHAATKAGTEATNIAGHSTANVYSNSGDMLRSTTVTTSAWLALWVLPFALLWLVDAPAILTEVGRFFSQLAVVTFGGAYAVLAYLAQDVVTQFGWLTAGEMMDGLGLAETTPGPLILVTEFVGFLAGFRNGGLMTGIAATFITLWVTFVPCFLWIFAGAPYIEWISAQARLSSALSTITAAVVGVILNLSLWFAMHVLFREMLTVKYSVANFSIPVFGSIDWRVACLTIISGVLVLYRHWNIVTVLIGSALGGLLLSLIF